MKSGVIFFSAGLILISIFLYNQNNDIGITNIDYKNDKIPKAFKGYKIAHISDLHNKKFGKDNNKLINMIKDIQPDIIVVTGDLIDSRLTKMNVAIDFMREITKISNVYYIPGNHEGRINSYKEFENNLININVNVLNNENESIYIGNDKINLIGMEDISFINGSDKNEFFDTLNDLNNSEDFSILLSHRPDLIEIYEKAEVDLVFTGHAHGGQIRLPFIGGLLAPNQGLLPKFTSGVYEKNNTSMIVSRGIGNSLFPFRIFNKPEIIVTNLN